MKNELRKKLSLSYEDLLKSNETNEARIISPGDYANKLLGYHKTNFPKGFSSGIPDLDNIFSWAYGRLYLFTGYDNSGKSAVLFWLAVLFAQLYKGKVAIYSPETDNEEIVDELARLKLGKNTTDIGYPQCTEQEYFDAIGWVSDRFRLLEYDELPTIETLLNDYQWLADKGFNMFITDPFNYIAESGDGMVSRYLKNALSNMKQFAKRNNVINIYVEHPKQPTVEKGGKIIRCSKYTINNGAMHRNKADCVVCIHKERIPEDGPYVNVFDVQKMKSQRRMGSPGEVELHYDVASGQFWGKKTGGYVDDGTPF